MEKNLPFRLVKNEIFSYFEYQDDRVRIGWTTAEKDFNLGLNVCEKSAFLNWQKLKKVFGFKAATILKQIHSPTILIDENSFYEKEGDGILYTSAGEDSLIGVTIADCLSIIGYSLEKDRYFVLHAGWRGLYQGIIEELATFVGEDFSAYKFFIGPHAKVCCYRVDEKLWEKFSRIVPFSPGSKRKEEGYYLDLTAIAFHKIKKYGGREIFVFPECTICGHNFFSYRREGKKSLRFLAYLRFIGA